MIDVKSEELISIGKACKLFPKVDGKSPGCPTVYRWVSRGCLPNFIKLEMVHIGGKIVTSKEAIDRFLAATA